MKYTDAERFINTTGKVRWHCVPDAECTVRIVLEQEMYANTDADGNLLQYPEVKWIEVPTV